MRGVLWMLPLLAVIAVIIIFADRPRFEKSFMQQVEETESHHTSQRNPDTTRRTHHDTHPREYKHHEKPTPKLTEFDPNTLTTSGFEALGFSHRQAEAIIRYREARGGFRTADDLGRSYVVSDEMMARLRPYIRIASPPTEPPTTTGPEPVVEKTASGPVEINTADSATLRTVSGIGNVLVVRILDYRERLGGYVHAGQLSEIPGMYPENFQRIVTQISVDSCKIQKIDVNFASPSVLGRHPYITAEALRKLLKNRQLKGGWRSTEELVNENILTPEQASRLAPYFVFN